MSTWVDSKGNSHSSKADRDTADAAYAVASATAEANALSRQKQKTDEAAHALARRKQESDEAAERSRKAEAERAQELAERRATEETVARQLRLSLEAKRVAHEMRHQEFERAIQYLSHCSNQKERLKYLLNFTSKDTAAQLCALVFRNPTFDQLSLRFNEASTALKQEADDSTAQIGGCTKRKAEILAKKQSWLWFCVVSALWVFLMPFLFFIFVPIPMFGVIGLTVWGIRKHKTFKASKAPALGEIDARIAAVTSTQEALNEKLATHLAESRQAFKAYGDSLLESGPSTLSREQWSAVFDAAFEEFPSDLRPDLTAISDSELHEATAAIFRAAIHDGLGELAGYEAEG